MSQCTYWESEKIAIFHRLLPSHSCLGSLDLILKLGHFPVPAHGIMDYIWDLDYDIKIWVELDHTHRQERR